MGTKYTQGSKCLQTEGRGQLGGSGDGMQRPLSPGEQSQSSPGEHPLQSCYYTRAAQEPAPNEDQRLPSSSWLSAVRQLVTPTPGTAGQPQKSTGDGVVQPPRSPVHVASATDAAAPAGLCPHAADSDREQEPEPGSIPGIA